MTPYLVTPPASFPVATSEMKAHLRVDFSDDDGSIEALQDAAVAHLDGWGGVLGRCIMPQTWAVDLTGPGPHLLPFPDASDITAASDGTALTVETARHGLGTLVTVSDAVTDQEVTITATYGLSAQRLPAACALIKLMVGNWYENREATTDKSMSVLPMAADALISALRWRRL